MASTLCDRHDTEKPVITTQNPVVVDGAVSDMASTYTPFYTVNEFAWTQHQWDVWAYREELCAGDWDGWDLYNYNKTVGHSDCTVKSDCRPAPAIDLMFI
jgi:hypothetical protein